MRNFILTILLHLVLFLMGAIIMNQILGGGNSFSSLYGIFIGYMFRVFYILFSKNKITTIHNKPTRLTFDGRIIKYENLEHQHLSNIYWFDKILNNREPDKSLMYEINERFNGNILSYKPLKRFAAEIGLLKKLGYVETKDGKEVVMFEGKEVGEIE